MMISNRSPFWSRATLGLLCLGLAHFHPAPSAHAYVLEGPRWPADTAIVMNLELGQNSSPLSDGFPSWDRSAEDALNLWNQYLLDGVRFSAVLGSSAANAKGNNTNTVTFAKTVFGQAFGTDTLAVTTYYSDDGDKTIREADVVFNSAKTWNSYRGPLQYDTRGILVVDFHRVAIHEFGHVLGLDHPNEKGQTVNAIMNSRVSDVDTLLQDDIDGVKAIYNPVGRAVKTFAVKARRLLSDPARSRVYAILPQDNALAVIDVNSLELVATLPVGSNPADLALSPDGRKLYVANSGSTVVAISVVDLDTLSVLPGISAPIAATAIAAGLDNRLYVLNSGSTTNITQIDASTGNIQGQFSFPMIYGAGFLRISPDKRTLYYGNAGISPSTLVRLDVSTPTVTLLQQSGFAALGSNGQGLAISHNGLFLVYPNGSGNGGASYGTKLISANDLSSVYGTFPSGTYPSVATFSPDDSLLYQFRDGPDGIIQIFSTSTFTLAGSFKVPNTGNTSYAGPVTDLVVTNGAKGYIFLATANGSYSSSPALPLQVFTTGVKPGFFRGEVPLSNGVYYLAFAGNGNVFGYYTYAFFPYLYHFDLGFEYFVDANDSQGGAFLYDFTSASWFYTSPTFPFPYLYDFSLGAFLYYYPDVNNPGVYTKNPRYFFNFRTNQIIMK